MHLWSRFINQDHTSFEVWYLELYNTILIFFCIKGGRKNRILYINKLYIRISCMAVSFTTSLDTTWLKRCPKNHLLQTPGRRPAKVLRSRTWTPFCQPCCTQICQIHIYTYLLIIPTSSVNLIIFFTKKHIANVAHVQLINYPF